MASLRGVIWDMDGVLVDTGEYHFQSWKDTLHEYHIPLSRDLFNETFGMNNEGILKKLLGDDIELQLITEISEKKETNFRKTIRGWVKMLPGVLSLLESIHEANIHQAIASSAPQKNIDAVIGELGIKEYFAVLVSGADMKGKPDPAVFLTAAQKINTLAPQCVVIEDGVPGVEAAHRAGMRCIAVATTNLPQKLGTADVIVHRLDEISIDGLKALFDN